METIDSYLSFLQTLQDIEADLSGDCRLSQEVYVTGLLGYLQGSVMLLSTKKRHMVQMIHGDKKGWDK